MNNILSQAIALQQQGNYQNALNLYQTILQQDSNNEIALVNKGILLFQHQSSQQGLDVLSQAVSLHQNSSNAHFNYAYALMKTNQLKLASTHFQKAINLEPNFFDAYLNLGKIYPYLGQSELAFACFEKAYALKPNNLELLNNWSNNCLLIKRFEQGLKILDKAIKLYPNQWSLYGNQATIYKEQWKLSWAEQAFKKAININPNSWELYYGLAAVYYTWNQKTEALACFQKALKLNPNSPKLYSAYLYSLNCYPNISSKSLFQLHQRYGNQFTHANPSITINSQPNSITKPIKVGLLSPDFYGHPVGVFLIGWLDKINPNNIAFYAYAEVKNRDSYTQQFQKICHWHETNGQSDLEIAKKIQQDEISILIDLAGHTGGNRLGVMGLKPAPIQISYLGYINTTGLTQIDYRIADQWVNPPETQQYYTEKLIYLPNSYTCYRPPENNVNRQPPPVFNNGFITFGCYNNPTKLNEQVVQLWATLLKALPTAKLRLKARHFQDEISKAPIVNLFQDEGIDSSRLILDGGSDLKGYFEAYNNIDIALDPFPHNGGTTTHDALFMGVPVITLEGNSYVSRMGVSILNNLGFPQWIAKTESEFVTLGIKLATDIVQLKTYRQTLPDQFLKSSLCNGEQFAQNMEALLLRLK